jgi:YggT family protein
MILWVVQLISSLIQLLVLVVIIHAVLSFFMPPYDPIRQTLDRFVNPMLNPIRRVIPPVSGIDFSPFVLIILLQVLGSIVRRIFTF